MMAAKISALLLAGAPAAVLARPPQPASVPYYTPMVFASAPGMCASLATDGSNRLQMISCCDAAVNSTVISFSEEKLGKYAPFGYMTTPPIAPLGCGYMYAKTLAAGEFLYMGTERDSENDPAAQWSLFRPTGDDYNQFMVDDMASEGLAANLCVTADSATGFLNLQTCTNGTAAASQQISNPLYDWSSVHAVCDPTVNGPYTLQPVCGSGAAQSVSLL